MESAMPLPVVAVHGGATSFKDEHHSDIGVAVQKATKTGLCVLERGGSALDAAEATIHFLENTRFFTAGRGACMNAKDEIEVEALIMDGKRLESGAVMAVKDIIHPISLARYVLERTPICQVAGRGANLLYKEMVNSGYRPEPEPRDTSLPPISSGCDTVGCVVVDKQHRIVSASSTSGWPGKLVGRVGDSPVVGAGVYANEVAGATCTGKGEQILRISMARIAVNHVENGRSVEEAVQLVMKLMRERTSGEVGLILADEEGNVAVGFDTKHMPTSVGYPSGEIYFSLKPKWPQ
jgi:beta-aspartyl-peptidase (threonine type)